MIKNLLPFAAMAMIPLYAKADVTTLWQSDGPVKIEWGTASCQVSVSDCAMFHVGDVIEVSVDSKTDDDNYPQFTLCGYDEDYKWVDIQKVGCWDIEKFPAVKTIDVTESLINIAKNHGIFIKGTAVLISKVALKTSAEVDQSLLWEGEKVISGWGSGGDISSSKVKAGDVLTYEFTGTPSSSGQLLVKNDSWTNLEGTAKISASDIATGKVEVGVTAEMLENAGSKFFLQGDMDVTLTKVTLSAENAFDTKTTLAYGKRELGSSQYLTVPENAKYLLVKLSARPAWLQICNSGWTQIVKDENTSYITNDDNTVTFKATLDEEVITAINEKKEMVLNGSGASVISVAYEADNNTGIAGVEAGDVNVPVEYYNLQGVRVENPTHGLYICRQGSKVTKIVL